jgi:capsular polysaccharide biosynthesis protein
MDRAFVARVLESYFRHRWLNLIPLALMMVGAVVWLLTAKPEYTSRGTVYAQGGSLLASLAADITSQTGWTSPAKAMADDLNSLLQSDAFMRSVVAGSELEPEMNRGPRAADRTLKDARKAVWTETLGQNMVLVGAAHTSPVVAQQLSEGVIRNYLLWRENNRSNEGVTAQSYFEKLMPQYEADVRTARQDLEAYLVQHPDPVRGDRPTEETFQIERLQAAVQEATQRLSETVAKAEKAKLAGDRSTIDVQQTFTIIDAPQIPPEPSTSRRKQALNMAVFFLAGLLLSGVAVIGGALLDTSLRFPADVQQKLGLPVLGSIPSVRPERKKRSGRRARKEREEPRVDSDVAPALGAAALGVAAADAALAVAAPDAAAPGVAAVPGVAATPTRSKTATANAAAPRVASPRRRQRAQRARARA